jgi:hypothetical protein
MSSEAVSELRLPDHTVVVVPGLNGSGVTHWQTFWESANPEWIRAEQENWELPRRDPWLRRLVETVNAAPRPVILVGHSLGCATIAHAAHERGLGRVEAAFLVAMPDVEHPDFPSGLCRGFAPLPPTSLPFPSTMVGSTNDPWITSERLAHCARIFGSDYVDVGARHHIGTSAGLGAWREGYDLFESFLRQLGFLAKE